MNAEYRVGPLVPSVAVPAEVRWQCPACGCYRATTRWREESERQVTVRLIEDHIRAGCSAYRRFERVDQWKKPSQ